MTVSNASEKPVSHFRLLLWLKFRLIWGSLSRSKFSIVGTLISALILFPVSIGFAFMVYHFVRDSPSQMPNILKDILATAYLFWFLTPLLGFSLNDSYDPTRLFVYPVRYTTIFTANVVGSLFEMSTLLVMPVLIALLAASVSSPTLGVAEMLLLLLFLLQTIAMGQALTLALLGLLRSRRFRDILIVLFPLIALARYLVTPRNFSGSDLYSLLSNPAWNFANYFPPGYTASAIDALRVGDWARAVGAASLLVIVSILTVALAVVLLKQIFNGERGQAPANVKVIRPVARRRETAVPGRGELHGALIPIVALSEKEWRYIVRDPQYKAMGMNVVYILGAFLYSFSRVFSGREMLGGGVVESWLSGSLHIVSSIGISGFLLFGMMQLVCNVFGGEGPAVTMLFSFPTPRRWFIVSKNIVHGTLILLVGFVGLGVFDYVTDGLSALPLSFVWLLMSTPIVLAAGNLVSVQFPSKLIVRGNRMSSGGQVSLGTSRGVGCGYGLLYLCCLAAAVIAEIPAAAAVIIPSVGLISPVWYWLTLPLGLLYAAFCYLQSLKLIDAWMITKEQAIILKLAPSD